MNEPWTPPTLETGRLVLRPLAAADADSIFTSCSNPELTRFTCFNTHRSVDDSLRFLNDYVFPKYAEGFPDPWGIAEKTSPGRIVGCMGLRPLPSDGHIFGHHVLELGYWITTDLWGRGFATEALAAAVEYAFSLPRILRLQARVIAGHPSSGRVLKKCGFQFEGTLRKVLERRGKIEDVHMYSRLRE